MKNFKIQVLRGLAIFAVVIIHSYMSDVTRVILRPFINFAVALFLFLSGYLTKLQLDNKKEFAKKRIVKVLIPYIVWSIIFSIPAHFENFALKLLTGRCNGIYYYIFVYIQFVILTPLIIKLIKSKYSWVGWCITPLTTIIFKYVFTLTGLNVLSYNFNYLFCAWFIYYYLGLYIGNELVRLNRTHLSRYIYIYIFTLIISLTEGFIWYRNGFFDMSVTQLRLTSIFTSVSFLLLCSFYLDDSKENYNKLEKVFIKIGDLSFGIYLSHTLVQAIISKIINLNLLFPLNSLIVLIVTIALVQIGKRVLKKHAWILGL